MAKFEIVTAILAAILIFWTFCLGSEDFTKRITLTKTNCLAKYTNCDIYIECNVRIAKL